MFVRVRRLKFYHSLLLYILRVRKCFHQFGTPRRTAELPSQLKSSFTLEFYHYSLLGLVRLRLRFRYGPGILTWLLRAQCFLFVFFLLILACNISVHYSFFLHTNEVVEVIGIAVFTLRQD